MLICIGVLLDIVFGEPKKWHPLVGFGRYASTLEKHFSSALSPSRIFAWGVLAWLLAVLPIVLIACLLDQLPHGGLLDVLVIYAAIAYQSLHEHVKAILNPLRHGDLILARQRLGRIVSRDTEAMDELSVRRGAIESALENGSDAIFAALFWWLVAGVPGVVLYRLSNTLDAMWGYRTSRYKEFGCFAARVDDVLNYVPARLTAFSYVVLGNLENGLKCWREQAKYCSSPNAGVVMCAGAGALQVTLGGRVSYQGEWVDKPAMGLGREPSNEDIQSSLVLLRKTLLLWCGFALCLSLLRVML